MNKKIIVSVSGGLGSAYALDMCIKKYGKENVVAVFADVKGTGYSHYWSEFPHLEHMLHERFGGESRDTYEFLWHLSYALDIPIERIGSEFTIYTVFGLTRSFLLKIGAKNLCKASEWLKREAMANWIEQNFEPHTFRMALGMGIFEGHRVENARHWWTNRLEYDVDVFSPMIDAYNETKAYSDTCSYATWTNEIELSVPKAYSDNLLHNNCAAKCVHAGQNQWAWLYLNDREGYLYAAYQEYNLRHRVGINATILKMERDGVAFPITLFEFIEYIETDTYNKRDLGGSCSCFTAPAIATILGQAALKETKRRRLPVAIGN